jgi:hypothetical protein
MRVLRTTVCSLALVLTARNSRAAAPPPGPLCQKAPAEEAFSTGMNDYSRSRYREAIPDLSDAARLCPKPGGPWSVPVHGFGEYPFLPFYFLGKSYYRVHDRPSALRNLYLSACFGESSRDDHFRDDLGSLTRQCRDELSSRRRPDQHPDFGEGFAALDQKRWEQAAERMWNALQVWDEDGRTTFSSGRWPDPYLPRYQLAEALFKLGCEREACEQLDRSLLGSMTGKQVEKELRRLAELTPLCTRKSKEPYGNSPICERWRCWLQQKGSTR